MSEATPLELSPRTTALVLIDLQRGIAGRQVEPHTSVNVIARGSKLAARFRELGATVVLVNVAFSGDGRDRLAAPTDVVMPVGAMPPDFSELVPELNRQPSDLTVTKRNWGAFYGTDLDLQLRRRGITTIVIGGISTNMGVESTARDAFEHNYGLVFVEDAMAGLSADAHHFAINTIFPRLGRVRSTAQVLAALSTG
jgi:nicotinamidase-related amidase